MGRTLAGGGGHAGGGDRPAGEGERQTLGRGKRTRRGWGQSRGRGKRRTLGRGPGPRRGGPSPAQPLPARPQSLGMKPPVVRARPADPGTLGPAFHSPGSLVGGKERRGSGAWLPAKAAAFVPGATRRPRLGGGRGGQRSGGSSAMGSRSSHAARIPDVDSLRQETGCECGAPRPGARRGPGRLRSGSRGLENLGDPGSPARWGVGGAFTQGSRLPACGPPSGPGPALRRTEADGRGGFGLPDLPGLVGLVTTAPSLPSRPLGTLLSASPPPLCPPPAAAG